MFLVLQHKNIHRIGRGFENETTSPCKVITIISLAFFLRNSDGDTVIVSYCKSHVYSFILMYVNKSAEIVQYYYRRRKIQAQNLE